MSSPLQATSAHCSSSHCHPGMVVHLLDVKCHGQFLKIMLESSLIGLPPPCLSQAAEEACEMLSVTVDYFKKETAIFCFSHINPFVYTRRLLDALCSNNITSLHKPLSPCCLVLPTSSNQLNYHCSSITCHDFNFTLPFRPPSDSIPFVMPSAASFSALSPNPGHVGMHVTKPTTSLASAFTLHQSLILSSWSLTSLSRICVSPSMSSTTHSPRCFASLLSDA